jgi:hypothetical protein
MDENEEVANPTLEERWAAVREQADAIGCEIEISIVVGGVDEGEIYRVRRIVDAGPTIADQLTTMERVIVDDRTKAAAEATRRMKDAEDIARLAKVVVDNRQAEYREAVAAFHQATSNPPSEGDSIQQAVGIMTTIYRKEDEALRAQRLAGRPISEVLAELAQQRAEDRRANEEGEQGQ